MAFYAPEEIIDLIKNHREVKSSCCKIAFDKHVADVPKLLTLLSITDYYYSLLGLYGSVTSRTFFVSIKSSLRSKAFEPIAIHSLIPTCCARWCDAAATFFLSSRGSPMVTESQSAFE